MTTATMRIQHKPGGAIQVDWAGDTLPVYDPATGEQISGNFWRERRARGFIRRFPKTHSAAGDYFD